MSAPPTRDALVRLISGLPPEQVLAAGLGWRLGVLDGIEQGIAAEERAEAARWHKVYLSTKAVLDRPTRTELDQRRATLRACRCDQCSMCVRQAAVERNRARYGLDDYPGRALDAELAAVGAP